MADDSGTQSLFSQILGDAVQFATPFAQKVFGTTSTPAQVQKQTLKDSTLNGSGPSDHILANQSPLGLWDFITGGRVTGGSGNDTGTGGLSSGSNFTFIGIAAIVIIAVFVILKK